MTHGTPQRQGRLPATALEEIANAWARSPEGLARALTQGEAMVSTKDRLDFEAVKNMALKLVRQRFAGVAVERRGDRWVVRR